MNGNHELIAYPQLIPGYTYATPNADRVSSDGTRPPAPATLGRVPLMGIDRLRPAGEARVLG